MHKKARKNTVSRDRRRPLSTRNISGFSFVTNIMRLPGTR
jgi:hypothetical protein